MKLITPHDIIFLRRCAKTLLALVLFGLWFAGNFFLYETSPFAPRHSIATGSRRGGYVAFAQGGKTLVIGTCANGEIAFWDPVTGKRTQLIAPPERRELNWLHDHCNGSVIDVHDHKKRTLYDTATAKPIYAIESEDWSNANWFAVSPDRKFVALSDAKGVASIHRLPPAGELGEGEAIALPELNWRGTRPGFSPDSKYLLAEFVNDKVLVELAVLESATGKLVQRIATHGGQRSWAFSDDGKQLAVTRPDNVALLETLRFTEIASSPLASGFESRYVGFQAEESSWIIVGHPTGPGGGRQQAVWAWNPAKKTNRLIADVDKDQLIMQFSSDHRKALALRHDRNDTWLQRLIAWLSRSTEPREGKRTAFCLDFSEGFKSFELPWDTYAFAPDGLAAASVRDDGVIQFWDIPPRRNWWRVAGWAMMLALPVVFLVVWCRRKRAPQAIAAAAPKMT